MSASDVANIIAPPVPWTARARLSASGLDASPLAPELRGGLGAVGRTVVSEEGMARALVVVHFHLLPTGACACAQLLADRGRGVVVLGADRREQRALELRGELERRRGPKRRGDLLEGRFVDEPAPAVDGRVEPVARAGEQERVAPAHAEADAADASIAVLAGA